MPVETRIEVDALSSGALVVAEEGGALVAVFLDGDGRTLTEVAWRIGERVETRSIALSEHVDTDVVAATLSGDTVGLSSGDHVFSMIGRRTGQVSRVLALGAPAGLVAGTTLAIAATQQGLVTYDTWFAADGAAQLWSPRPLAIAEIDSPRSLLLIPGKGRDDLVTAVVGGYGCLALIKVAASDPPHTTAYPLTSGDLPYDPLYLQAPAPLYGGAGQYAFAVDWGRAGVAAIDLATGEDERCPLDDRDYGAIRTVVPRLDGRECIIEARTGWLRWTPGQPPRPIEKPAGRPMLWQHDAALMLDVGNSALREAELPR